MKISETTANNIRLFFKTKGEGIWHETKKKYRWVDVLIEGPMLAEKIPVGSVVFSRLTSVSHLTDKRNGTSTVVPHFFGYCSMAAEPNHLMFLITIQQEYQTPKSMKPLSTPTISYDKSLDIKHKSEFTLDELNIGDKVSVGGVLMMVTINPDNDNKMLVNLVDGKVYFDIISNIYTKANVQIRYGLIG